MPPAVPKLIQRFRARELQRLLNVSGLQKQGGSVSAFMRNVDAKDIPMGTPLHNPFLPRALPVRSSAAVMEGEIGTGKSKVKERKTWAPPRYSLRRQVELVKAARASGTLHLLPPGPKLDIKELEEAKREARRRAAAANRTSSAVEKALAQADAAKVVAKNEQDAPSSEGDENTTPSPPTSSKTPIERYRWVLRSPSQLARRRVSPSLGYPGIIFRWTGKVPKKSRSALTIYATRRRMFKGHKWERYLNKRRTQIAVRMRDMPQRIDRFKNVYKKRRPRPLKPAPARKKESLPF